MALCKSDDERVRLGAITAALDRGWGKPAQALQIKGDPDSPVIFNLRLGDGMKTIDGGAVEVLPVPGTGLDGCSVSGREGTDRRVVRDYRQRTRGFICRETPLAKIFFFQNPGPVLTLCVPPALTKS